MKRGLKITCAMIMIIGISIFYSRGAVVVWSEDFEGEWYNNWYVDNGTWEVGVPTSGPGAAYNGQKCAATVLAGNYAANVTTRIIRLQFVVPEAVLKPRLRFWHWYNFASDDYGKVQIKPTGSSTWIDISTQYQGSSSNAWTSPLLDLSAYAGQTVQLAFFFNSDPYNSAPGWYIDDVSLVTGPMVFNNPEDWEGGLGDWSSEEGTWEVGTPTTGPGSSYTSFYLEEFTFNIGSFSSYSVVGAQTWSWGNFDGGCMQISGKVGSTSYSNEDWLISPGISLAGKQGVKLSFREAINYITAYSDLKVMISTNYDGTSNPSVNGAWTELTGFTRAPGNSWNFVNSGDVSLAAYQGQTIHLAFRYLSTSTAGATWEISRVQIKAGLQCAATKLTGNYSANVSSRLVSPAFIVPNAGQNPRLRFWHWYNFQSSDYGQVQIKPAGSTNWTPLGEQYINTGSGTWTCPQLDLTLYAGQTVQLAFYFYSDPYNESSGWYFDNLSIITGPLNFNNPEGWENGIGDWNVDHGTWEIGLPTSGPLAAQNSEKCAATKLGGNYASNVETRLISVPVTIPNSSDHPRLRFWHWFDFQSDDFGQVQIKAAGNPNWIPLSTEYVNTGSNTWTCPLLDLSSYGGQTIEIAFYFSSDPYNESAGWYIDNIEIVTGPLVYNNPEGWESGIGDWNSDFGTWETGIPTSGPGSAHSGSKCAGTRLGGTYAPNVESRLISPPVSIPEAAQNPRLRFWHWFNFQSDDYGKVQIKDIDSVTWSDISANFVNTSSGVWTYPYLDLAEWGGKIVQIAFLFHSDPYNESFGWYIDDIVIQSDCTPPGQPGAISGNTAPCSGASYTYSISPVSGATSYTWTYSGSGTPTGNGTSCTLNPASSGTLSVTAGNACGSGPPQTLALAISAAPAQPGTITGNTSPCSGIQYSYSISPVSGATSYLWTYSGGGSTAWTNNNCTLTPTASGLLSVTAANACGSGPARTLALTVSTAPAQPGAISGNTAPCAGIQHTYSISPVAGATSYSWTYSGSGSPAGTGTSCTLSPATGGTLSVTANNACGSSSARTLNLAVSIVPPQPGTISGNTTPCMGVQYSYSISPVAGATSYTWAYSGSGTPAGTGTSCMLAPATGGNLSVTANNACGSGTARQLALTVITNPPQPGSISGNATPCSGIQYTYSVNPIPGITVFTWSYTGSGTPTGTGSSCTLTPASSGILTVVANNSCGISTGRSIELTVASAPTQSGPIAGPTVLSSGIGYNFSIDEVIGATTYQWSYSGAGSVSGNGTSVTLTATGNGTLSVTPSNDCGAGPARTLDLLVTNTPQNLTIYNSVVVPGQYSCFNAAEILRVGENYFIVMPGGNATLIAGQKVQVMPGCQVSQGGYLHAKISSDGVFCQGYKEIIPIISAGESEELDFPGEETSPTSLRIYPNPGTGIFFLESHVAEHSRIDRIVVLNLVGETVLTMLHPQTQKAVVDLTSLPRGLYIVRAIAKDSSLTARLILQ